VTQLSGRLCRVRTGDLCDQASAWYSAAPGRLIHSPGLACRRARGMPGTLGARVLFTGAQVW